MHSGPSFAIPCLVPAPRLTPLALTLLPGETDRPADADGATTNVARTALFTRNLQEALLRLCRFVRAPCRCAACCARTRISSACSQLRNLWPQDPQMIRHHARCATYRGHTLESAGRILVPTIHSNTIYKRSLPLDLRSPMRLGWTLRGGRADGPSGTTSSSTGRVGADP